MTKYSTNHMKTRQSRQSLKVGDKVDAQDTDKKWYEARVIALGTHKVNGQKCVRVHYHGWTERWDEWHEASSPRLQALHTFTADWRKFKENQKVEVRCMTGSKLKWYTGVVYRCPPCTKEGLVLVKTSYSVARRWLATNSEEICQFGTHINTERHDGEVQPRINRALKTRAN